MKVNYVLMYGTPYLKYREFETFEDISKFLINKRIVNYSIFKKLEDKEEVEMIYRDNDIRYLEQENQQLKKQKDDVVEYIKKDWYSKNTRDINRIVIGDWRIDILRMLGEIE